MSKLRQFIRRREGVHAEGFDPARAFREALESDGIIEFLDEVRGAEPCPAFRLQACGVAVLILTPHGQHLGTYADPVRAAWAGFAIIDHAAQPRRLTRPSRARRRTTREAQP